MNELKELLTELGLNVSEVTIKYSNLGDFGLEPNRDDFIIKGFISKEDQERLGEIITEIKTLHLQERE